MEGLSASCVPRRYRGAHRFVGVLLPSDYNQKKCLILSVPLDNSETRLQCKTNVKNTEHDKILIALVLLRMRDIIESCKN